MSTNKPATATASEATSFSKVTVQPPTKSPAARRVTAKKPVIGKPVPLKPAVKKLSAAKAPSVRTAAKSLVVTKPEKGVKASPAVKLEKAKKPKLIRDSFTIPKVEYIVLEALKQRATRLNRSVKKSELLRAGIKALAAMHDTAFLTALELVPAIKTGRPVAEK